MVPIKTFLHIFSNEKKLLSSELTTILKEKSCSLMFTPMSLTMSPNRFNLGLFQSFFKKEMIIDFHIS